MLTLKQAAPWQAHSGEAYITLAVNITCRKGFRFVPSGEQLQKAVIMKISQVNLLSAFNDSRSSALSADADAQYLCFLRLIFDLLMFSFIVVYTDLTQEVNVCMGEES